MMERRTRPSYGWGRVKWELKDLWELWNPLAWDWDELTVRVWLWLQMAAAGYTAWLIGEPLGTWLFGAGAWNALWGGVAFLGGVLIFSSIAVMLPATCIFVSRLAELWCLAVMGGSAYLAVEYGRLVGEAVFSPAWQPLGPFLTWFIPCVVLGFPVAWWDLRATPGSATRSTGRGIIVVTPRAPRVTRSDNANRE